jgi:hypothetical protein
MTALKQMGDKDLKDMGIPMVLSFHSDKILEILLRLFCCVKVTFVSIMWVLYF